MPGPVSTALLVLLAGATGATLAWLAARRSLSRHGEAVLRRLLDHSIDAAYRRDLRTDTYDYLSPALERVMGVSADQLRTMPVHALIERIHADDRARVIAVVEQSARQHAGRVEYRFLGNDGAHRWIADHYAVELDTEGHPAYRSGILRDVSEQHQADAALRSSEVRYRMLFESIEDGFCIVRIIVDRDGSPCDYQFVEANPAFAGATGLHDAVGRTALEMVPDLDRWWVRTYADVARTGEPIRFEHRADAMKRWFDVYAFRFGSPDEGHVAIFFKNVTQRKAAELERARLLERERTARAEAERASLLKDDFLATVSHELRTPLNAMLGWAQILARGADATTTRRGLGAIERNAVAQSRLIEDLLDMSRIVSGTIRLDVTTVDLAQVVTAAIDTARPAAQAKGVRLEMAVDGPAIMVRGDATRLPQVAWNLLSNAVKFTGYGGTVRVTLTGTEQHVVLTVVDTGQGIAPDFLPHVFERFRQADASTTRIHGGLGLGLAIVKQIVELHGGRVSAHSDGLQHGATFVVELPGRALVGPHADGRDDAAIVGADREAIGAEVSAGGSAVGLDDESGGLPVVRPARDDRNTP